MSPIRVIDRLGLVSNSTASSGVRLRSQTMSWPESPGAFRSASTIPSSVKPSLRGTAALATFVTSQTITTTSTSGRLSATSVRARAARVASPRLHQSTWIQ